MKTKHECIYEIKNGWRKCNICSIVQNKYQDKWIDVLNSDGNIALDINSIIVLCGVDEDKNYYGYNPKKDLRVEVAEGSYCTLDYVNWNENKQKLVGKHSWIKEIIDDRYCKLYGTDEIFAFATLIPVSRTIVHMGDNIFNMNKPQSEQICYLTPP